MTVLVPLLMAAGVLPAPETNPAVIADKPVCHVVGSESVLARDVAPWLPGFAQLPADFLVGYVESSGAPRIFRGADLERIAKTRGVDLHSLADLCLQRSTFVVQASQITLAMQATLKSISPDAKIEILSSSEQAVPTGEVVFPRSGVQPPLQPEVMWRGYVESSKGTRFPIWARARVTVSTSRMVATTDLQPGQPIQSSQVRLEPADVSPFDDTFASPEEAVGLLPRVSITKGSALRKSQLRPQMDVASGETVRVDVYSGNAHLSMDARAETAGMKGSVITVRNISSGRNFEATVAGRDRVRVGAKPE